MGRGLGPRQKLVLRLLEDGAERYETELVWEIAIAEGRIGPMKPGILPPSSSIPPSVYHGVRRGIAALVKRGHLVSDRRRLASLDELGRLYPYRTKNVRERFGRELMLPALIDYARNHSSQFARADNETHVMSEVDPDTRARLRLSWRTLDRSLVQLEAGLSDSQSRNVFALRVRGRQLFDPARVHHDRSFHYLLGKALDEAELEEEKRVLESIRHFYDKEFPRREVDRASMKTMLYSAVDTRTRQRPGLKPAAAWHLVDFLTKNAPEVAAALGCRPRKPRPRGMALLSELLEERKGPNLGRLGDRLLDRDAFAKFTFVRRVSSSVPSASS